MKRFGFAIRTGGDPEIAEALAGGIERGTGCPTTASTGKTECPTGPLGHLPIEMGRQGSEAVRRVAMMRHTPEEWEAMIVQARYDYGQDPPTPRWAEALLVGYALICYGVSLAFRRLWVAIEGRPLE